MTFIFLFERTNNGKESFYMEMEDFFALILYGG